MTARPVSPGLHASIEANFSHTHCSTIPRFRERSLTRWVALDLSHAEGCVSWRLGTAHYTPGPALYSRQVPIANTLVAQHKPDKRRHPCEGLYGIAGGTANGETLSHEMLLGSAVTSAEPDCVITLPYRAGVPRTRSSEE